MSGENPFRAPWPNPKASICTSPSLVCPVKGKSFWSMQGPALRAYNDIKNKIRQSLKDREQDLYDDADESFVPHSIDCLMVGSNKEKARPYMVISCSQMRFSRKAMKVIKSTTWWNEFIQEHLGFGGFLLLRYAPRRMADANERTQMSFVFSFDQHSSLCGMPVFFAAGMLGSDDTCTPQKATFGNIIYLDDVPFGLTVAHPLAEQDKNVLEQYTQRDDAVFYMDDSDDGSSLNSESTSASPTDIARISQTVKSTELVQSQPLPGSPSLVGQVVCSSEGTPSDGVDWALIALNARHFSSMQRSLGQDYLTDQTSSEQDNLNPNKKLFKQHSPSDQQTWLEEDYLDAWRRLSVTIDRNVFRHNFDSTAVAKSQAVVSPAGNAMPVLLPNGKNGFSKGFLNANESLVCLPGSRHYLLLHSVVLEEDLHLGECGKWAFDDRGNWCGHIVAGTPGTRTAYVAWASQIVADIQKKTGIAPSISPGPRSHKCARKMSDFSSEQFDNSGGLYGPTLFAASVGGHEKVVQMLLDRGADVNAQGWPYRNAIQAASDGGHEKLVQTLLDRGADVNAQGGYYGDALHVASEGGHEKIVQMLLDRGADMNAQEGDFGNALYAASISGHEKVVQMLFDRGADVNAQGGFFGNALLAASACGREKVVQMLLDRGADVNAQGGSYGNALLAASDRGHEKIVQMLLDAGAEVNA